jgi:hypothetical protein
MKTKKRWEGYQVDREKYSRKTKTWVKCITTKSVAELTEAEAKDELCSAMDLIAKLVNCAGMALDHARKQKFYI